MSARVVVVGDVVTDVIVRATGPATEGSDTSAAITVGGGGSAANLAAWLATTGTETHLVGRVGADVFGDYHTDDLRGAGVTPHLARDPRRPTAVIVVLVGGDGERSMVTDRGAALALASADLPDRLLRPGHHLHLSAYVLLDEATRPAGLAALAAARAAGMTTSVDPSSHGPLQSVGAKQFLGWTAGVDFCLPNTPEARLLTGAPDATSAATGLTAHYREVVVTDGARGAVWAGGGSVVALPAEPATVVDTTGAGDACCAGFLAARLGGADPRSALGAGLRLAARAVATTGGRPQ